MLLQLFTCITKLIIIIMLLHDERYQVIHATFTVLRASTDLFKYIDVVWDATSDVGCQLNRCCCYAALSRSSDHNDEHVIRVRST